MDQTELTLGLMLLFGIVSAKWAMELGFSQFSQLLHGVAGLFLGPLVLLVLYVRLLYQRRAQQQQGSQMFGTAAARARPQTP